MYSYGPPHMAVQKQDDQHEHTFSSYVRIRDVVLKTYLGRWTIGRSGKRGSRISVLPARYDDDDDIYVYIIWIGIIYILLKLILCIHIYVYAYIIKIWIIYITKTRVYIYIYIYIYIIVIILVYTDVLSDVCTFVNSRKFHYWTDTKRWDNLF